VAEQQDGSGGEQAGAARRTRPTSPRRYRHALERDLVVGGFLILFVVGGGLAWLLYGFEALVGSWVCLAAGAALLGTLYAVLKRTAK
jgi:hypothetical protein